MGVSSRTVWNVCAIHTSKCKNNKDFFCCRPVFSCSPNSSIRNSSYLHWSLINRVSSVTVKILSIRGGACGEIACCKCSVSDSTWRYWKTVEGGMWRARGGADFIRPTTRPRNPRVACHGCKHTGLCCSHRPGWVSSWSDRYPLLREVEALFTSSFSVNPNVCLGGH